MTANGNNAEPKAGPSSVRIRSSVYLLGNYEMKAKMPGEISSKFLTLVLAMKNPKAQDVSLDLSFKHIVRVDLLDNSEKEGAGMVVYVNNFMAKKIEKCFNFEPNSFLNFRNPYMNHSFIIFDILNSDRATISTLKDVLNEAAEFHKNYLLDRFKAENDPEPEKKLPKQFVFPMTSTYWKGLLGTMHKEFFIEEVTIQNNDGKDIIYTSGYMINVVSNSKCAVQSDGRIMPVNSDHQESLISIRRRTMDQQPRTFTLGRLQGDGPPPKLARYVTQTSQQPLYRPKIDEVHTIEDEPSEASSHSANDTVYAIYHPPNEQNFKIYKSDVATLGHTEMVNDTIVDFYMKYIFYDLMPKELQNDFHVFNSFFYTKLSKGLNAQRLIKTRSKKISDNYSTLKTWTKNVNIFAKKYIIVPINEDAHWYLAVIMNPSIGFVTGKENINGSGETTSPISGPTSTLPNINAPLVPVFIFDSLLDPEGAKKHRALAELLLEYLHLEFRDKKNEHQLQGVAYRKNACRVVIPENMPQQQNHYDCGIFMLQFAESFMSGPPQLEEIPSTISYGEMFGQVDLEQKREQILKLISDMNKNSIRSP